MKKSTDMNDIVAQSDIYLSDVSHDAKNVLASIKAYTQLLKLKIVKKQYDNMDVYLTAIDSKTDILLQHITDLVSIKKKVKKPS